ncbi:prenyltransferase/squalene oxidase repeat-containing protein [Paenibacillus tarimensis]
MEHGKLLERAKQFIYNNARLIDRKRYEYHFEGGSQKAVIEALRGYQNPDGGFGNALEPDIRCPHSQPVPTEMALQMMEDVDAFDPLILEGIARYLRKVTLEDGGIPFVLKSVNHYPHAPWWTTESDRHPSINPTGTIIGLLYKQKVLPEIVQDESFLRNVRYIWDCLEREEPSGFHDGVQWIAFLQHTPDRERANAYWQKFDKWLSSPAAIERDPYATGYVHKVLDWAPACDSYARKFISDEELHNHLQALARQQQEDGGWLISFPAVSPAGEQEWRGYVTVERLKTLKSYGVLQGL